MTTCEKADIILQNKLIFDHINNFKDTKFFMNEILKIMTNNPEKISTEEAINIVMHLNKKLKKYDDIISKFFKILDYYKSSWSQTYMHFQILFAILKSLKWYKSVYKRENINKCRKYENFPYQILNKLIELQINYWPEMVQLEPKNVDVLKQYFIEDYSTDKIIRESDEEKKNKFYYIRRYLYKANKYSNFILLMVPCVQIFQKYCEKLQELNGKFQNYYDTCYNLKYICSSEEELNERNIYMNDLKRTRKVIISSIKYSNFIKKYECSIIYLIVDFNFIKNKIDKLCHKHDKMAEDIYMQFFLKSEHVFKNYDEYLEKYKAVSFLKYFEVSIAKIFARYNFIKKNVKFMNNIEKYLSLKSINEKGIELINEISKKLIENMENLNPSYLHQCIIYLKTFIDTWENINNPFPNSNNSDWNIEKKIGQVYQEFEHCQNNITLIYNDLKQINKFLTQNYQNSIKINEKLNKCCVYIKDLIEDLNYSPSDNNKKVIIEEELNLNEQSIIKISPTNMSISFQSSISDTLNKIFKKSINFYMDLSHNVTIMKQNLMIILKLDTNKKELVMMKKKIIFFFESKYSEIETESYINLLIKTRQLLKENLNSVHTNIILISSNYSSIFIKIYNKIFKECISLILNADNSDRLPDINIISRKLQKNAYASLESIDDLLRALLVLKNQHKMLKNKNPIETQIIFKKIEKYEDNYIILVLSYRLIKLYHIQDDSVEPKDIEYNQYPHNFFTDLKSLLKKINLILNEVNTITTIILNINLISHNNSISTSIKSVNNLSDNDTLISYIFQNSVISPWHKKKWDIDLKYYYINEESEEIIAVNPFFEEIIEKINLDIQSSKISKFIQAFVKLKYYYKMNKIKFSTITTSFKNLLLDEYPDVSIEILAKHLLEIYIKSYTNKKKEFCLWIDIVVNLIETIFKSENSVDIPTIFVVITLLILSNGYKHGKKKSLLQTINTLKESSKNKFDLLFNIITKMTQFLGRIIDITYCDKHEHFRQKFDKYMWDKKKIHKKNANLELYFNLFIEWIELEKNDFQWILVALT